MPTDLQTVSLRAVFILRHWLAMAEEQTGNYTVPVGYYHAGALSFPFPVAGVTTDSPMTPAEVEHYGAPYFVAESMTFHAAQLFGALYNVRVIKR